MATCSSLDPTPALARSGPERAEIAIPPSSLAIAIAELSRQTGVSIGAESELPITHTRAVQGRMTPAEALERMLAGTGFAARQVGANAWRIVPVRAAERPAPARPPTAPPPLIDNTPIVVTATKESEPLGQVARALAVFQPATLASQGARAGTGEVAAMLDGLTLSGSGPGRNQIFLRGVADSPFSGASQSTVAVLLDGVRLTWSAPDPDLRLVDVKRVEVLKGPQGTLYGQGALGGIYQIVSNRADSGQTEAMVGGGLSTLDDGAAGYSGSAMLNLPLARDSAALRLVGFAARDGGWIETGPRSNSNLTRTVGGRANLGVEAGAGWRIDLSGALQRIEAADSQYVYAPASRSRPAQVAEPHDNDLNHGALHVEGTLGGARLVALSGLTWHEVRDRFDATIGAAQLGLSDPQAFDYDRKYRVWDNELRLTGAHGALHWLVGLSHVEARQDAVRALTGINPGSVLTIDEARRTSADTALFANLVVPLGADFSLEGGGRLFRGVIEDQRSYAGQTVRRNLRRLGFTPGMALSWRPRPGRTLYLRYGSALRQGGLGLNAGGQLSPVDGDELATVEAGWNQQLPRGGTLALSGYVTRWNEVQSDMLLPSGLIETRNAGRARIIGAELALDLPLGERWRAGLGAAVQDARLTNNALGIPLDDRRLPVVPSYTARAMVQRDFALGTAKGWLRATLRAIGPGRLSFDPALDRPMGRSQEMNVALHLAAGGFEWELAGTNLLSGRANVFGAGNPFRLPTMPEYTPQRPMALSLNVLRQF